MISSPFPPASYFIFSKGNPIPDWPKLLHLYSRLKPGKTVYEWKEEYAVEELGIDIRRFTSFGVIKGFLRRVHRWPVYLPPEPYQPRKSAATAALTSINASYELSNTIPRKRGHSLSNVPLRFPFTSQPPLTGDPTTTNTQIYRTTRPKTAGASSVAFPSPEQSQQPGITPSIDNPHPSSAMIPPQTTTSMSSAHRARRASAAEKILEHLRNRDKTAAAAAAAATAAQQSGAYASPRNSWIPFQHRTEHPQETSSSLTPPAYDTHARGSGGGNSNASGSVTPTHTMGNLPTPTLTAKSLHGYGHGHGHGHGASGSTSGPGAAIGIGPGATLVSGLPPAPLPQGSPSRGLTTTTATALTSMGSNVSAASGGAKRPERRSSLNAGAVPPPSPVVPKLTLATPSRPRISRSPSATQIGPAQFGPGPNQGTGYGIGYGHGYTQGQGQGQGQGSQGRSGLGGGLEYPPQLIPLLDGEHHTDELCTKFEVGWPLLEKWLELIGGGEIGSEEGRVVIIYR